MVILKYLTDLIISDGAIGLPSKQTKVKVYAALSTIWFECFISFKYVT